MTGLWTTDRDTLNQGVSAWLAFGHDAEAAGDYLVNAGWVRVLDPDDTELVEQVAKGIYQHRSHEVDDWTYFIPHAIGALEALRQP
jgi:hypothetical protein